MYKPDKSIGLLWGQRLGTEECTYLRRWVLNFGKFAIRVHHWYASDDLRAKHNHPWKFATLVLKGGYTDISEQEDGTIIEDKLRIGSIRFRKAHHRHTVQVNKGGAWTFMITGPFKYKWGFFVNNEFFGVRKYFKKFGHHQCE